MNRRIQPVIPVNDRDPSEAEQYARQLAIEIERTGVEPVEASVSDRTGLEITFEGREVFQFNTLYSGRPGTGPRTTARVLWLLGFRQHSLGELRRRVTGGGNSPLVFVRTPTE